MCRLLISMDARMEMYTYTQTWIFIHIFYEYIECQLFFGDLGKATDKASDAWCVLDQLRSHSFLPSHTRSQSSSFRGGVMSDFLGLRDQRKSFQTPIQHYDFIKGAYMSHWAATQHGFPQHHPVGFKGSRQGRMDGGTEGWPAPGKGESFTR